MISKNYQVVLMVLFALLVLDAYATGSPGEALLNNSSTNVSSIDNVSINNSSVSSMLMVNQSLNNSLTDKPARIVPVMDLSHYGKDRLNKSLTGYKNIIYPMTESSGFTATTSVGGGGGCGC
jgi:hypothetical protein